MVPMQDLTIEEAPKEPDCKKRPPPHEVGMKMGLLSPRPLLPRRRGRATSAPVAPESL
jgi:hypothetical protein